MLEQPAILLLHLYLRKLRLKQHYYLVENLNKQLEKDFILPFTVFEANE